MLATVFLIVSVYSVLFVNQFVENISDMKALHLLFYLMLKHFVCSFHIQKIKYYNKFPFGYL